jgi:hypothetical protein
MSRGAPRFRNAEVEAAEGMSMRRSSGIIEKDPRGGRPARRRAARLSAVIGLTILMSAAARAATPIAQVNYQGVLRNASGVPLDGDYDMIFRFWSAAAGGDEILVDDWSFGVGGPVHVTKGLFNVALGAGFPTDGAGPGTYTSLAQVFRDYSPVFLEVRVGAETLSPRTLILSAPTALNADHLDGKGAADFLDTSATPQTKAGQLFCADGVYATSTSGGYGIEAYGAIAGGFFHDVGQSGFGWIGYGDRGVQAGGLEMGAFFSDSNQSGSAEIGSGDYGIKASGSTMGGRFQDSDGSGVAQAGSGDDGLYATGNAEGVFGYSPSSTGYGVRGQSAGAGGFFEDRLGTGHALVGKDNRGIESSGSEMGGYFNDTDNTSWAYIAYGNFGVEGLGTTAGGYFTDSDLLDSGYAYVGYGDYGIQGFGESAGGYFKDSNGSGAGYVGIGDVGVFGSGSDAGGHLNQTVGTGDALLAWSDRGIQAVGNDVGGYFGDLNSSAFGMVGYGTYKIYGNGAMSFVQNHPHDPDRVVVYTAPEGDETATYTRGTARLTGGMAKVPLGETFALVTNPEIGLTAYVTPRGRAVPLAVESLSTSEMVVRGPAGEDVPFDYIVYGLRIGFEETTVVQEKKQEARIPSMADHRRRFQEHPELRGFTASSRFGRMEETAGRAHAPGGAAAALRAAIEEFDPAVHGRPVADREPAREAPGSGVPPGRIPTRPDEEGMAPAPAVATQAGAAKPVVAPGAGTGTVALPAGREEPREAIAIVAPVGEPVEAADVLVAESSGLLMRGTTAADRSVVGIAAGEPATGQVSIVVLGFAACRVDASYGAIRAGDLLTTSPTPGRAMRADEAIPGTILGKALEPLPSGVGTIRVLVAPR